jgi:hypothetical protein
MSARHTIQSNIDHFITSEGIIRVQENFVNSNIRLDQKRYSKLIDFSEIYFYFSYEINRQIKNFLF